VEQTVSELAAVPLADRSNVPMSGRASPLASAYVTELASSEADVAAAQRLRFTVFAEEMGAHLPNATTGIDRDPFDQYCDHLLVRSCATGQVVGTYRVLTFEQARRAGGFYSANEFDLRRIAGVGPRMVELGRACVHPDHRDGIVIALLWAGLFDYIFSRGYEYVIGCGSVTVANNDRAAIAVCNRLKRDRLSPSHWRVFPYRPFPLDDGGAGDSDAIPPLIKAYLRLGAFVCGDPAWDRHFGTADFLMLLPVADINPRYVARMRRSPQRGSA
jgi:putative hemolysin